MDMDSILISLASERSVFHCEADLKHALAWKIHQTYPECVIRLEWKPPGIADRLYADICVRNKRRTVAIELKYATHILNIQLGGERFDLVYQGAANWGRYDFLKDVQRLEMLLREGKVDEGYALFVTNNSAYWNAPRWPDTYDAAFRIHEGRVITGKLEWSGGVETTGPKRSPIEINGEYTVHWQNYPVRRDKYPELVSMRNGVLRYLRVHI